MKDDFANVGSAKEHSNAIEEWMRMILATGGVERFDDLHVDQIARQWETRESWLHASSEALSLAYPVWQSIAPGKTLALMCSLSSEPNQNPPESVDELITQIDWSPPSLYLFEPGSEPWSSPRVQVSHLGELFANCTCLLMHFTSPDTLESHRSFAAVPLQVHS